MIDEKAIAEGIEFLVSEDEITEVSEAEQYFADQRRKFLESLEQTVCCRGDDEDSCKCQ